MNVFGVNWKPNYHIHVVVRHDSNVMLQKVEEHRTVRDNHGNEEEIVTKKIGDQGYSVTKKRDSIGREEVKEDYTNMDKRGCHFWFILF